MVDRFALTFSISYLRSLSFVFCVIGSNKDISKGFKVVPWDIDIFFFWNFATLNGPPRRDILTLYTFTRSFGRIKYFVAGDSFDLRSTCILDSVTFVSIYVIACSRDGNRSDFFGLIFARYANLGIVLDTGSDGSSSFGPIRSLMAFIYLFRVLLCCNFFSSDFLTSKILVNVWWYLLLFPMEFFALRFY